MYITDGTPSYMLEPVEIGWSEIHGQGLIATQPFSQGEAIVKAVDAATSTITYLGLFINHQKDATCTLRQANDGYWVVSLRPMRPGEEITVDYQTLPRFLSRDVTGFIEI